MWAHILFIQQASNDRFSLFMSPREAISHLGGEANKIAYQLMLFLEPLREKRESCELDCYLEGDFSVFAAIRFILFVLRYSSLSEEAGRSGLYCRWLLKLLTRVSYADKNAKREFDHILEGMKRVLSDAPALSLLPYYSSLVEGLKNILLFAQDAEQVAKCYSIIELALKDMIRDQAEQELSVLAIETMHHLVTSLPSLSLRCYAAHLDGIRKLFSTLDSGYCFTEFQNLFQFAEGGFADATAVGNVEALLRVLILMCDRCPEQVRRMLRNCCLRGFDAYLCEIECEIDSFILGEWLAREI